MFGLITSLNAPGKLYFFGFNNDLAGVTTILPNVWYHAAVTYDGSTLKLYLNGRLEATKSTSTLNTVIDGNGLTIGLRPDISARWQGLIDEVEIFDRALSGTATDNDNDNDIDCDDDPDSEICQIFLAGSAGKCRTCTPPPSMMVSWWLGEGDATDIQDSNNGTLQGDATFATGKVDQAFSFDGTGDFVQVPDAANLDITSQITIDAWIKRTALGRRIVDKITVVMGDGYLPDILSTGELRLIIDSQQLTSSASLPLNAFTHVAGTYDSTTMKVYINGVLDGSLSTMVVIPQNNNPLRIGADQNGINAFNGLIDEVEVFNRALSAEEIQDIVSAGYAGKCVWGDGSLDPGEFCDDGNKDNGDCCDEFCQFEPSGSAWGNPSDTACDDPDTCDGAGMCQSNMVMCGGMPATICGTAGRNTINGTSGPNIIHGLGEDDNINGHGGNDKICGGDGNDVLNGNSGNDQLFGENGMDTLDGNNDADQLFGGNDNDTLFGNKGNDTLDRGDNTDICNGGQGIDTGIACEPFVQ